MSCAADGSGLRGWWLWGLLTVGLLAVLGAGLLAVAEGAPPPQDETSWPTPVKELSLAVPTGNGYYPQRVVVAPGTDRIYTYNGGKNETGKTISVLDGTKQQVIATYSLNVTDYDPGQLAVAPTAGRLYVTAVHSPTLYVFTIPAGKLEKRIEDTLAVAVDEAAGRLYLAGSQELRVLATKDYRLLGKVALASGGKPRAIAVDRENDRLYMLRDYPQRPDKPSVDFYVASSLRRLATFPLESAAEEMVGDPAAGRLYVAYNPHSESQEILVFDAKKCKLLDTVTLEKGWGYGALALDAEGGRLFAAKYGERPSVVVLSTSDLRTLAEIPLKNSVYSMAFDSATGRLYSVDSYNHRVLLLDIDRETTGKEIYTAVDPFDLVVDAENGRFYVSDSSGQTHAFDSRTFAEVGRVAAEGYLSLDTDHGRLYVGQPPASPKDPGPGVAVVDTEELRLVGHIPLSGRPQADPATGQVYIVRSGIYVADPQAMATTGRIAATFPISGGYSPNPYAIDAEIDSQNRLLYAIVNNGVPGSNNGNYLYVFDLETGQQVFTDTERSVGGVAPDPANKRAYVIRRFIDGKFTLSVVSEGRVETARLVGVPGYPAVDPRRGRLYMGSEQGLWVLDADTLGALLNLPLEDKGYHLAALDDRADRLYFIGSTGQILVMSGHGGAAPREETVRALASLPLGQVNGVFLSPDYGRDKMVFAAQQTGLHRSTDGGRNWTELGGGLPSGQAVNALAFSPAFDRDKTVFAALSLNGEGGGLYKSDDGGLSWRLSSVGLTDLAVQEVVVSPDFANDQTIFARSLRKGLFRSHDGGAGWQPLTGLYAQDKADVWSSALAVSPDYGRDETLFVGIKSATSGFFRSTDGGETWQRLAPEAFGKVVLSPAFGTDNTMFAILDGRGIYRSEDGGESWQAAASGLDFTQATLTTIAVSADFARSRTLYALILPYYSQEGASSRLYRSTDAGRSWQQLLGGPAAKAVSLAPAHDADGEALFLGTTDSGVVKVKAADSGLRWGVAASSPEGLDVSDLAVSPAFAKDRTAFALTAERGLFISTDGGESWQQTGFPVRSGLADRFRLALSPDYSRDKTIFVATSGGLYRSRDGGRDWQGLSRGLPAFFRATSVSLSPDFARDKTVYVGGDYHNPAVYISRNGGDTWSRSDRGLPGESSGINRLSLSPDYANDKTAYAWVGYMGFFKTGDGGQSWEKVLDEKEWYVQSMAFSPDFARDRTIFLGLLYGRFMKSQDGGATWQEVSKNLPLPDRTWSTALTFSPTFARDHKLFVGTDAGVYRSDDGGKTWQSANRGLPTNEQEQPVGVFALATSPDFARDGTLFAGLVGNGVYVSGDGGASWHKPGSAPVVSSYSLPEAPPTPCATPPAKLAVAWEKGRDRIGCPQSAAAEITMAGQTFQHGLMFWRGDDRSIYVLLGDGRWQVFDDAYAGEAEPGGYTPPSPELAAPLRGFGKVWRERLGGANAAIGWGAEPERGFQGLLLVCEKGHILQDDRGHSYLMYQNGEWERAE